MREIIEEERGKSVLLDIKIGYWELVGIAESMPELGIFYVYCAGVCDSYFQKDYLEAWTIIDGNQLIPVAVEGIGQALDNTFN